MVRPIDLQDNFSKAPLAGREQQIQQSSADLGQRALARELEQQHQLDQSRPVPTDETDATENRVDDRDKGQSDDSARRHRGEGGDGSSAGEDVNPGTGGKSDSSSLIDIVA